MFEVKKSAPPLGETQQYHSYPFAKMDVGDWFELEKKFRRNVSSAASAHKKRTGREFTVRKAGDGYICRRIK